MTKALSLESFTAIDKEYREFMGKAGNIMRKERVDPFETMIAFLQASIEELEIGQKKADETCKKAQEAIKSGNDAELLEILKELVKGTEDE